MNPVAKSNTGDKNSLKIDKQNENDTRDFFYKGGKNKKLNLYR